MDLDLGQQISIIGSTPEERVVKAAFMPLSERYTPGYFEIVSEKNSPDDPSARILDTLALGEGIQVGGGVWAGIGLTQIDRGACSDNVLHRLVATSELEGSPGTSASLHPAHTALLVA